MKHKERVSREEREGLKKQRQLMEPGAMDERESNPHNNASVNVTQEDQGEKMDPILFIDSVI